MHGEAAGRQRHGVVRWPPAGEAAGPSLRAPGGRVALSTPASQTHDPRAGGGELPLLQAAVCGCLLGQPRETRGTVPAETLPGWVPEPRPGPSAAELGRCRVSPGSSVRISTGFWVSSFTRLITWPFVFPCLGRVGLARRASGPGAWALQSIQAGRGR